MNRRRWTVTALWGILILTLTSIPGSGLPDVEFDAADKLAHATLYAVLAFLAARAVDGVKRRGLALALVLVGVSALGAVDEWHQRFIPGRSTEVTDWVADSLGAALGLASAAAARRREQQP